MGNEIARLEPTKNRSNAKSYHQNWALEPVNTSSRTTTAPSNFEDDKCKARHAVKLRNIILNIRNRKSSYLEKYEVCLESLQIGPLRYNLIEEYIMNSQVHEDIFEMKIRKVAHVKLINEHQLPGKSIWLWHGTQKDKLNSIFKHGLKLPSPSENNLVGQGIYFADRASKSAQYCYKGYIPSNYGYILLCRVFVGRQCILSSPNKTLTMTPTGYNSVYCQGEYIPNPKHNINLDGDMVPLGVMQKNYGPNIFQTALGKGLKYNEYVIYNPENVQIKYVVKFKFIKK